MRGRRSPLPGRRRSSGCQPTGRSSDNTATITAGFLRPAPGGPAWSSSETRSPRAGIWPALVHLKPAVVHLLAGTNDLAGNTGPTTLEAIEHNLSSMVEIAAANHIRVVLGSVLPALDYPWRPGLQPASRIGALNDWVRAYGKRRHLVDA